MLVHVLFFAQARDATGVPRESYQLSAGSDLTALTRLLERRHPRLAQIEASCRYAVNLELAEGHLNLSDGDEVAVLPPVAGG